MIYLKCDVVSASAIRRERDEAIERIRDVLDSFCCEETSDAQLLGRARKLLSQIVNEDCAEDAADLAEAIGCYQTCQLLLTRTARVLA